MDFCLIRGIFEVNSPAIDRKNNEEVGKKTFILSKGLCLDSFLESPTADILKTDKLQIRFNAIIFK